MEEYDEQMKMKLEKEYKKKMDNADDIKQQHHEFKMKCIKRIQEEMLEGELIKKQVEDEIMNERQKEEARRKRQEDMREELKKANTKILESKEEEKRRELEEEERVKLHAKKME